MFEISCLTFKKLNKEKVVYNIFEVDQSTYMIFPHVYEFTFSLSISIVLYPLNRGLFTFYYRQIMRFQL